MRRPQLIDGGDHRGRIVRPRERAVETGVEYRQATFSAQRGLGRVDRMVLRNVDSRDCGAGCRQDVHGGHDQVADVGIRVLEPLFEHTDAHARNSIREMAQGV